MTRGGPRQGVAARGGPQAGGRRVPVAAPSWAGRPGRVRRGGAAGPGRARARSRAKTQPERSVSDRDGDRDRNENLIVGRRSLRPNPPKRTLTTDSDIITDSDEEDEAETGVGAGARLVRELVDKAAAAQQDWSHAALKLAQMAGAGG